MSTKGTDAVTFGSPALSDICHIGFVVPDMTRALTQFAAWGCKVIIPPETDTLQAANCALLQCPGQVPVELVAPAESTGNHPLSSRLKRGGGLDHVCIFVDDVEAEFAAWGERRAVLVREPSYAVVFDRVIAFVMAPGGLLIELMSRNCLGHKHRDPLKPIGG